MLAVGKGSYMSLRFLVTLGVLWFLPQDPTVHHYRIQEKRRGLLKEPQSTADDQTSDTSKCVLDSEDVLASMAFGGNIVNFWLER